MYAHLEVLQTLPNSHRTLFAASCAQRLLPNYRAFYSMENWGQPGLLDTALEYVWISVEEGIWDEGVVARHIEICEKLAPDSEDFTTLFTGAAINAAGAVFYALKALSEGSVDHAQYAGQIAIDTIYDFLFEVSRPISRVEGQNLIMDAWLDDAPLLLAEIEVQQDTLSLLYANLAVERGLAFIIRQMSDTTGIRPYERGLVKPTTS